MIAKQAVPRGLVWLAGIASWLAPTLATEPSGNHLPASHPAPPESLCVYGGGNGALWLVRMDSVAKELALTPDQARQFTRWAEELSAEQRAIARALRSGQGPAYEQRAAEKRRHAAELNETYHRQVVEQLDQRQRTRLDELYIRRLGPRALFESRIVARLALSEAQQQALRNAGGSGEDPPPYEKRLELLTEPQRQRLTAMQGDPFAFPQPRFIRLEPGKSDHAP
jgi:hypothetical protein